MKNEKGFTLIEVIVSLALLGVIGVALLSALSTASLSIFTADERATAESLARSQMEYVKSQDYDGTNDPPQYTLLSDIPNSYGIGVTAERMDPEGDGLGDDDGIQKITVTVSHLGEEVMELEGYKVDR